MGRLERRVAVVTGGSRGIGRAICDRLAADGARVAVVARTEERVAEAAREIVSEGGTAVGAPADVTDLAAVESMVRRVESELGPIDVLVNNAGGASTFGPVAEADPVAWWHDVTLNLLGSFHTCRTVLPGMLRSGRGRIINLVGAGTAGPVANYSGYGSAKAALMRLTETLALEVEGSGVKVFALDPGLVRTPAHEPHLESGAYERWFPGVVEMFERGLDLPPTKAAGLATEIASGGLDDLHGRCLHAAEDPEEGLAHKDRILAEDLRTLRLRELR